MHVFPVKYLIEYVKRTQFLRQGGEQLLVSHQRPYCPDHVDTVSRWIKTTLTNAVVNTKVFAAPDLHLSQLPLLGISPGYNHDSLGVLDGIQIEHFKNITISQFRITETMAKNCWTRLASTNSYNY